MYSHLEPGGTYPEPTRMPQAEGSDPTLGGMALPGNVEEWRYDADGTRYRVIVVTIPATARVLVAIDPDKSHGRSWWIFDWSPGDTLGDDYIAEKWRINPGDDLKNLGVLIRAALQR